MTIFREITKNGTTYYFDGRSYYKTNFKIGDHVKVVNSLYKDYRLRPESPPLKITFIRDERDRYGSRKTSYEEVSPDEYANVYGQEFTLEGLGNSTYYKATNFKLVKEMNMGSKILSIGVDRPCVVWLLEEIVNADGTVATKRVGEPTPFVNMQSAQAWAQKQIQDRIRADNVYDKYAIFEEKYIAAAKEPPVVFE